MKSLAVTLVHDQRKENIKMSSKESSNQRNLLSTASKGPIDLDFNIAVRIDDSDRLISPSHDHAPMYLI